MRTQGSDIAEVEKVCVEQNEAVQLLIDIESENHFYLFFIVLWQTSRLKETNYRFCSRPVNELGLFAFSPPAKVL